jgi:signal transduction histidine kinase
MIWTGVLVIAALDLLFPPGFAVPLLFIPLVFFAIGRRPDTPGRDHVTAVAVVATVWTVAEIAVSPQGGDLRSGVFNRGLVLAAIWLVVWGVRRHRALEAEWRAEAALAHVGRMAGVMAHEIRNPLAGVRGGLQVLGGRLAGSPTAPVVGQMIDRLDALSDIVENLLRYARPGEPRRVHFPAQDLVTDACAQAQRDPLFADVEWIHDAGDALVVVDPAQIALVLASLLRNAAQAMQGRGRIEVSLRVIDGTCVIRITDSGPGVPPDLRGRVGEVFFTTKSQGPGLGIATARRLLAPQGGSLAFEYPKPGGTTAVVRLPVANGSTDPSKGSPSVQRAPPASDPPRYRAKFSRN